MKHFSKAVLASLVVTTSTLAAYPNNDSPVFSIQKFSEIPDPRNLSYDEIMDLLAFIESDSFEEKCSIDELDQINRLISFLAMEGATENEKTDVEVSIASLFKKDGSHYAYWIDSDIQSIAQPAIFRDGSHDIILCKSWAKKQWGQTKKFVKKHKKAIIIGVIVVVAVTVVVVTAVVVSSSVAGGIAGGLAASAGALDSESSHPNQEGPLTSSLQEQISTFKENIAQEQLAAISSPSEISMEENGRIIGSLFTHKMIDTLDTQIKENPFLDYELQNLGLNSHYPPPKWASGLSVSPHASTDLAFSTNYTPTCIDNNTDLNTLTYQTRGDWALTSGCYTQAVQDFGRAIEYDPNDPNSYLGRGVANFELGHYEESAADYNKYAAQAKPSSSVTDFSIGFAKGLPQGICDSGEGMLLFVTDLARHPIQTGEKVYDSISTLSSLAKSGEWNLIGEALSPELHQLVSDWDTLSAREKGELSGYAFGKHGADILLPGAAAKAVGKGSMAVKELSAICKNLQSAEKLLVLEAV
ncbi:MAG: tetratricopeptide repeat protein, partial [Verrucomicrobiota bacterium]|nr:tetratricopeptide repeat protein [Verrucomicrobiota bacterium]